MLTSLCMLLFSCVSTAADAVAVRGTVHVDGAPDDAAWKTAVPYGDFAVFGARKRVNDTAFRAAYDETWFYLGIECRNEALPLLQPKVKGHDNGAMKDESVEVFLAPRVAEPAYYYHYALGFGGARDERIVTGPNVKEYWDLPWRSAVRRTDNGWTAEIAIPLSLLRAEGGFHALRLNVARNRRVPVVDSQNVVLEESRESSSWSAVNAGFHEQTAFRPVRGFPADLDVRQPSLVGIDSAAATEAGLRVTLRNHGAQAAVVRLSLSGTRGAPLTLAARQTQEVVLPKPDVADANPSSVELRVFESDTGDVLAAQVVEDLAAWRPLTAFSDRNYYTTETELTVHYRVPQPAGLRLIAASLDGEALAEAAPPAAQGELTVPMRDGIVLQLRRGERVVFEQPLQVRRLPPQPGAEWQIDRARRIVLNNGQPFVPFGMIMAGVRNDDERAFAELAAHGFNTFVVWAKTSPQGMAGYQRLAAKHGLYLVSCPDECAEAVTWETTARYSGDLLQQVRRITATDSLTQLKNLISLPISVPERNALYGEFYRKNIARMIAGVDAVKQAPNLAAHFIMDEPMAIEALDQVKFGQDYYARVRRADGHHPVLVNYSSHIPEGDDYTNWCDILAADPYWHPPAADDTRSTPDHVAKIAWLTDRRAEPGRQAVWQILACPRWSRCFKRPLTRDEIRCQTYLALIYRATGIIAFAYGNLRESDWETCARLGAEIRTLEPFIAGPSVESRIRYERAVIDAPGANPAFRESPFDPKTERYPDVHATVLTNARGQRLLLAANSRYHPVRCRFVVDQLTAVQSAFDSAGIEVRDQAFEDTLEPFATRAWLLHTPESRAVTVRQIVLKSELAQREPFLPGGYRAGRKNVLPNPSFENAAAAGVADYCLPSPGATLHGRDARFGRYCLQLTKTTGPGYENVQLRCDPPLDAPQTFTFSVYLKADQEGRDAWLRSMNMNPEKEYGEAVTLRLSTAWQRYSITGVIPAKVSEAVYEIRLREPGTIWIDGAQLEVGRSATAYED